MPRKVQRIAWTVITGLLGATVAGSARGDHGLEAEFTTTVRAGQPATLAITLGACCPGPVCGFYYASGLGTMTWGDGDGFIYEWYRWDSGPKPRPQASRSPGSPQKRGSASTLRTDTGVRVFEQTHTYERPGRYRVGVHYEDSYIARDTCDNVSNSVFDWLTVDVLPNPSFTPDGWLGTFFDPEATICSRPVTAGTAIYIVARLSGRSAVGINVAEFRLLRTDRPTPQFLFTQEAIPGWIAFGAALGDYGVKVLRRGICSAAGEGVIVPLLKLTATPLVENAYTNLFVTSPIHLPDAVLSLCESGSHRIVAGKGYTALISTFDEELLCPGITSVQERTWSEVKALYRD